MTKSLTRQKKECGAKEDIDLDADYLKDICKQYLGLIKKRTGTPFPQDPMVQLRLAIEAVFKSWMGKRAVDYRKEFNITPEMANGTAVNVCTMVFGNMGFDSATGVAFTRDPGTGENILYGEYLVNAQGEDVVAGIRTPKPIQEMKKEMPKIYRELERIRKILEEHFHEVQDFEFTVEKGTLYILQTRNGKMNAQAIVRTSKEMVDEKLINKEKAVLRLKPQELEQLLHKRIDPNFKGKPICVGLPASPGAASGKAVFDADEAERLGKLGPQGHIGTRGNETRGYSWLLCCPGDLDEPGRKDLPCRSGRKGYGQTLCIWMRRAAHRSTEERDHHREYSHQGRRFHHHRWLQGRGLPGRGPYRRS